MDKAITTRMSVGRADIIKAVLLAAAFVAVFWKAFDFVWSEEDHYGSLISAWLGKSDWSHGPIIPLFSAYLIYSKWDKIRQCRISGTWVGLVTMLLGLGGYFTTLFIFTFGYLENFFMMFTLLGIIIFTCGLPAMRFMWIPWLYLFFAIPLPMRVYFKLTNPLREFAAKFATSVLSLDSNLNINQGGSVIKIIRNGSEHLIGVADACSGMRSTITLCAVGVAVAFLSDRPKWQRIVLVASCLPIAVFCNFLRVLATTYLFVYVDEKYATGNFHTLLGIIMLGIAFGIFSGLGWVLNNLVVESNDDGEPDLADA